MRGALINRGQIKATGERASGIWTTGEASAGADARKNATRLGRIENHGQLLAQGAQSSGLHLSNVTFTSDDVQIVNSGVIRGAAYGILIEDFQLVGASSLWLHNSGEIVGGSSAIDVSQAKEGAYLYWQGGRIEGAISGLNNIQINGEASFKGSSANAANADIRMRDGSGWVDVGESGNAGHWHLEQAHTTIDGSLDVASGSSLDLDLSSATDPGRAILSVTGDSEFANGAQVRLAATGQDFTAQGSQYTLFQAASLEDNGLSVVSRSPLLSVDSYEVAGGTLLAHVSARQGNEAGTVIGDLGGSRNAQRAMAAFTPVASTLASHAPDDVLFQHYIAASQEPTALRHLAEQLAANVDSGAQHAAIANQRLTRAAIERRSATNSAPGGWVQSLYGHADQGGRDGVAGYNRYSQGVAVGVDASLDAQTRVGAAYSYLHSTLNGKRSADTEVDGSALSLYGSLQQGHAFADASLTYGFNDNHGKRSLAGTQAKANYNSRLLGLDVTAGYRWAMTPGWQLQPQVVARYSRVDLDGYREKGSAAALRVSSQRFEAAELGSGLRLSGDLPMGQGHLLPQARLMGYHDFAADRARSTSNFLLGDARFVSTGASSVRNSYEAALGSDYRLGDLTVGLDYSYGGKTDYSASSLSAHLSYAF
ncbi:MAG: Extracellular serine protease [Pseudomonas citronellolis]|nr:MAG: Extracellular serine protease [Pseudomonas citronellolis]